MKKIYSLSKTNSNTPPENSGWETSLCFLGKRPSFRGGLVKFFREGKSMGEIFASF